METLIGFAIGFVVGTRQGKDGLRTLRRSFDAIRTSPEVRELLSGGVAVAGSMARQVLTGGAGPVLASVVEAVSHKAGEMFGDDERRAA